MPFFSLFCVTPSGGLGQPNKHYLMKEKECKYSYESPVVEVIAAHVESGYQTSGMQDEGNANTTRYDAGSWDNPQYT